jgi:hypothetical protein
MWCICVIHVNCMWCTCDTNVTFMRQICDTHVKHLWHKCDRCERHLWKKCDAVWHVWDTCVMPIWSIPVMHDVCCKSDACVTQMRCDAIFAQKCFEWIFFCNNVICSKVKYNIVIIYLSSAEPCTINCQTLVTSGASFKYFLPLISNIRLGQKWLTYFPDILISELKCFMNFFSLMMLNVHSNNLLLFSKFTYQILGRGPILVRLVLIKLSINVEHTTLLLTKIKIHKTFYFRNYYVLEANKCVFHCLVLLS